MPIAHFRNEWGRRTRAGICTAGCLAAVLTVLGGEPIQFSSTSVKLEAPRQNPLEQYLNRPFESLKPESSLGPVIGPDPTSLHFQRNLLLPDKDERNRNDWRNSWIFALPQNLGRQETTDEMFNTPAYGVDGRAEKKLTLMEEYFQERDQGNKRDGQTGPNEERRSENSRGKTDSRGSESSYFDEDGRPSGRDHTELDRLFGRDKKSASREDPNPWNNQDALRSKDLTLGDLFKEMREFSREERRRDERSREFQAMLDNPTSWTPLTDRRDLSSQFDQSFQQDNLPTVMRELMDYRNSRRSLLSPSDNGLGLGSSSRGSVLDAAASPLQLAPSSPTDDRPAQSLRQQRERPAVLPVPKPAF